MLWIQWRDGARVDSPFICLRFRFFHSNQYEKAKTILHGILMNRVVLAVRFLWSQVWRGELPWRCSFRELCRWGERVIQTSEAWMQFRRMWLVDSSEFGQMPQWGSIVIPLWSRRELVFILLCHHSHKKLLILFGTLVCQIQVKLGYFSRRGRFLEVKAWKHEETVKVAFVDIPQQNLCLRFVLWDLRGIYVSRILSWISFGRG